MMMMMQAVGIQIGSVKLMRLTDEQPPPPVKRITPSEARISLLFALASHTASLSSRLVSDFYSETANYLLPKQFHPLNPHQHQPFMPVPDLETVKFKVLRRSHQYEIRQLEPYFVAEVTIPGRKGFDFYGASQSFNVLADYLFGKNVAKEKMEMTTPVITRKTISDGQKMEMTTPVITTQVDSQEKWKMSFVMPSKYGAELPIPKDPAVRIREMSKKIVAVAVFSGYVTDEEVKRRESILRASLKNDKEYQVKVGALVEVAQYNPPFTLPFTRRNEIALEVEKRSVSS